jgi:hypothetical protein
MASIVSAGAIPPLVRLLAPGTKADLQCYAAGILASLSQNVDEYAVAIAGAGAVPRLVHLIEPGTPSDVANNAAVALLDLSKNDSNKVTISAAGAIPLLVKLRPGCPAHVNAAGLLQSLAENVSSDAGGAAQYGDARPGLKPFETPEPWGAPPPPRAGRRPPPPPRAKRHPPRAAPPRKRWY